MASPQDIAELRLAVQEPSNTEPYTDDMLGSLLDTYGPTEAEYKIWTAKRNAVAALVDISEGGSSRKMSQVYENYNKIVAGYEAGDSGVGGSTGGSRTREITR